MKRVLSPKQQPETGTFALGAVQTESSQRHDRPRAGGYDLALGFFTALGPRPPTPCGAGPVL